MNSGRAVSAPPLEATRGGAETALPEFMKKFAGGAK